MLKIRARDYFEIIFFVERMSHPLASSIQILPPTCTVKRHFENYIHKYGHACVNDYVLKSFCFMICESRVPVIQD